MNAAPEPWAATIANASTAQTADNAAGDARAMTDSRVRPRMNQCTSTMLPTITATLTR